MSKRASPTKRHQIPSAVMNNQIYLHYYNLLRGIAISSFDWEGIPESIDKRFIETTLYEQGFGLFSFDSELRDYVFTKAIINGPLNIYNIPIQRVAYANNGYHKAKDQQNSVIVYNNVNHTPTDLDIRQFAYKLFDADQTITVNINAQKTPVLLTGNENQMLSLRNVYSQYVGNQPVLFTDKNFDINGVKVLKTDAPFVADRVKMLKTDIFNECLTFLGIPNVSFQKNAHLLQDEVNREMGGVFAQRETRLKMRQEACEQINSMFGLNLSVKFHDFDIGLNQIGGESENNEPIYDRT